MRNFKKNCLSSVREWLREALSQLFYLLEGKTSLAIGFLLLSFEDRRTLFFPPFATVRTYCISCRHSLPFLPLTELRRSILSTLREPCRLLLFFDIIERKLRCITLRKDFRKTWPVRGVVVLARRCVCSPLPFGSKRPNLPWARIPTATIPESIPWLGATKRQLLGACGVPRLRSRTPQERIHVLESI